MSLDRFVARNWFACTLVLLHTLLIAAWAWIELDDAWNDMNPTMLVMAALHVADYPIHQLLRLIFSPATGTGTVLAATLAFGGLFWFGVGLVAAAVIRWFGRTFAARRVLRIAA
jgi:hypothetical protein